MEVFFCRGLSTKEKKKKSISKEFVGGEREDAAWNNTTMMKFPRKLINRDIRPFNSRVVSHLRIINYTMERWSIRESVQKVKFFFLPSIRSDRFQWWIERSNGTRSSFVKRLKSIRSNEFNLDSTLDESDSIWIWFVLLRKTFEWPFRILIPNDTRLLWNEKDRGYIFLSIINSLNFVLPFLFFFLRKKF